MVENFCIRRCAAKAAHRRMIIPDSIVVVFAKNADGISDNFARLSGMVIYTLLFWGQSGMIILSIGNVTDIVTENGSDNYPVRKCFSGHMETVNRRDKGK